MPEELHQPHHPRFNNVPVMTKFNFRHYQGRVFSITFTCEDEKFIYNNSFDVMKPDEQGRADYIMTALPAQMFVNKQGILDEEKNRLSMHDTKTDVTAILYDDKALCGVKDFTRSCAALWHGCALKTVAMTREPKQLLRKEGQAPAAE